MKIIDSIFTPRIIKTVKCSLGDIFFFEDIAIVELAEATHFDRHNAKIIIDELSSYFGHSTNYGVIANRINSYSVNLIDAPYFKRQAKNLTAYGVVGHDLAGKMNAEMENGFCFSEKVNYDTLKDAVNSVSEKVKESKLTLN